ncbi:hypothetical protein HK096_007097 [Nowakowskiella sp. JEL0078]|nr:hypothetical protein HK096_007097 [Nowakowskiella sp. JEL0078]
MTDLEPFANDLFSDFDLPPILQTETNVDYQDIQTTIPESGLSSDFQYNDQQIHNYFQDPQQDQLNLTQHLDHSNEENNFSKQDDNFSIFPDPVQTDLKSSAITHPENYSDPIDEDATPIVPQPLLSSDEDPIQATGVPYQEDDLKDSSSKLQVHFQDPLFEYDYQSTTANATTNNQNMTDILKNFESQESVKGQNKTEEIEKMTADISEVAIVKTKRLNPAAHRHYKTFHPVCNKLLAKKWDKADRKLHLEKLAKAKPTVDNTPPRVHMHLQLKLKKLQVEEDRISQIERENYNLLEKMNHIMKMESYHKDYTWQEDELQYGHSLNYVSRKREQSKIGSENQAIFQRLENKVPEYDHYQWLLERRQNVTYLQNISTYPAHYIELRKKMDDCLGFPPPLALKTPEKINTGLQIRQRKYFQDKGPEDLFSRSEPAPTHKTTEYRTSDTQQQYPNGVIHNEDHKNAEKIKLKPTKKELPKVSQQRAPSAKNIELPPLPQIPTKIQSTAVAAESDSKAKPAMQRETSPIEPLQSKNKEQLLLDGEYFSDSLLELNKQTVEINLPPKNHHSTVAEKRTAITNTAEIDGVFVNGSDSWPSSGKQTPIEVLEPNNESLRAIWQGLPIPEQPLGSMIKLNGDCMTPDEIQKISEWKKMYGTKSQPELNDQALELLVKPSESTRKIVSNPKVAISGPAIELNLFAALDTPKIDHGIYGVCGVSGLQANVCLMTGYKEKVSEKLVNTEENDKKSIGSAKRVQNWAKPSKKQSSLLESEFFSDSLVELNQQSVEISLQPVNYHPTVADKRTQPSNVVEISGVHAEGGVSWPPSGQQTPLEFFEPNNENLRAIWQGLPLTDNMKLSSMTNLNQDLMSQQERQEWFEQKKKLGTKSYPELNDQALELLIQPSSKDAHNREKPKVAIDGPAAELNLFVEMDSPRIDFGIYGVCGIPGLEPNLCLMTSKKDDLERHPKHNSKRDIRDENLYIDESQHAVANLSKFEDNKIIDYGIYGVYGIPGLEPNTCLMTGSQSKVGNLNDFNNVVSQSTKHETTKGLLDYGQYGIAGLPISGYPLSGTTSFQKNHAPLTHPQSQLQKHAIDFGIYGYEGTNGCAQVIISGTGNIHANVINNTNLNSMPAQTQQTLDSRNYDETEESLRAIISETKNVNTLNISGEKIYNSSQAPSQQPVIDYGIYGYVGTKGINQPIISGTGNINSIDAIKILQSSPQTIQTAIDYGIYGYTGTKGISQVIISGTGNMNTLNQSEKLIDSHASASNKATLNNESQSPRSLINYGQYEYASLPGGGVPFAVSGIPLKDTVLSESIPKFSHKSVEKKLTQEITGLIDYGRYGYASIPGKEIPFEVSGKLKLSANKPKSARKPRGLVDYGRYGYSSIPGQNIPFPVSGISKSESQEN